MGFPLGSDYRYRPMESLYEPKAWLVLLPVIFAALGALILYAGLEGKSVTELLGGNPSDSSGGFPFFKSIGDAIGGLGNSVGNSVGNAISSVGGVVGGGKAAYSALSKGRLDQGVDYSGTGDVGAVADGTVIHVGLWPGWPGTGGVVYKTAQGNVYVMEHFQPTVRVGQHVTAGQTIGHAPGGYPFIETGFANAAGTGPLTPYNGAADGTPMPGAYQFERTFGL